MKLLPRIVGLVLGLAPCSLLNLSALTVPEIVAKAKPAVVQIIAVDTNQNPLKRVTGFFITGDGVLVTNDHILAGAADLFAQTGTGAIYIFRSVIFRSVSQDLALLKFAATGVPYLKLASSVHVVEGQRIIVIGRPEGLEETVSDGIISAFRNNRSSIQITAAFSAGSSGSPVLDESGQVIGIATSTIKESQNLNFAVSVETLKTAFLANAEQPPTTDRRDPVQP
jgi:S1-C subfamily serine protease